MSDTCPPALDPVRVIDLGDTQSRRAPRPRAQGRPAGAAPRYRGPLRREAADGPRGARWRDRVRGMGAPDAQAEFLRSAPESEFLRGQVARKWRSYRRQDQIKGVFDPAAFVALPRVIALLRESGLRCTFCGNRVRLFYADARAPDQWTLDRVDNGRGHNADNVEVACLRCNLQRRCRRASAFRFAKQMTVEKVGRPSPLLIDDGHNTDPGL